MDIKLLDRFFAAFLTCLGLYIVVAAVGYGLSYNNMPGAGFFPIIIGGFLTVLSGMVAFRKNDALLSGCVPKNILVIIGSVVGSIVAFLLLAEIIGFTVGCFLLMLAVGYCSQEKERRTRSFYGKLAASTVGTCIICHFFFKYVINVPLLVSPLGF